MSYHYCHNCEGGLSEATFAESVMGVQECRHCHCDNQAMPTKNEALIELEERLQAVERHLGLKP